MSTDFSKEFADHQAAVLAKRKRDQAQNPAPEPQRTSPAHLFGRFAQDEERDA